MKVLLVDDEEEMVSALSERLSLRGIETDCVLSGMDAVKSVLRDTFDVVVLDVKMPGMNGLETMEKIQEIQPEAKIIFLTGHGSLADCEAGINAGACFYLMKPVNIDVLIESLKGAMDK